MANYQESEIVGTKWKRCNNINIHNPAAPALPGITFSEQEVLQLDTGIIQLATDGFSVNFNPANMIELVDPDTLEKTGETIPEGAVYLALFSRYIAGAKERDEARLTMVAAMTPAP